MKTPTKPPATKQMQSRGPMLDIGMILGLLISIGLGAFTAFGHTSANNLLGLIVGLVGVAVTLQVDNLLRLERRFDAEDGRLRLLKAVEEAPELLTDLTHIAETASKALRAETQNEFTQEARQTIQTARAALARIANGQLVTRDGNTTFMDARLHEARTSVRSTSFASDFEWWTSSSGVQYLELNRAAVMRGAHVERVFIMGDISEEFTEVLDNQIAAGVQVYIARDSNIPLELCRNIAIYDGKYLVEDQVNAAGTVTGYLHSINESDVADALGAFARLKTLSRVYPRPATGPDTRRVSTTTLDDEQTTATPTL